MRVWSRVVSHTAEITFHIFFSLFGTQNHCSYRPVHGTGIIASHPHSPVTETAILADQKQETPFINLSMKPIRLASQETS